MSLPEQPNKRLLPKRPDMHLPTQDSENRYDMLMGVVLAFAMAIGVWVYAIKPWQTTYLNSIAQIQNPFSSFAKQAAQAVEHKNEPPASAAPTVQAPLPVQQVIAVPTGPLETPSILPAPQVNLAVTATITPAPIATSPPTVAPPISNPAPLPANVVIRESIEFGMGKTNVPESAQVRLLEIAARLKDNIGQFKIVGHTDSIGFTGFNRRLSLRRANSVKAFLVEAGVNAEHLGTEGMGEAQPIADNQSTEGRNRNRRIEIIQ